MNERWTAFYRAIREVAEQLERERSELKRDQSGERGTSELVRAGEHKVSLSAAERAINRTTHE